MGRILIESITPTAKRLIAFKDNVDCYYGFKNNQNYEIDGQLFGFEVPSSTIETQRLEFGYLNRKGESLFPQYKYVSKMNAHYYTVAKTIDYDDNQNIVLINGVVNDKGELILDCRFTII
jgi:hypothetical protein